MSGFKCGFLCLSSSARPIASQTSVWPVMAAFVSNISSWLSQPSQGPEEMPLLSDAGAQGQFSQGWAMYTAVVPQCVLMLKEESGPDHPVKVLPVLGGVNGQRGSACCLTYLQWGLAVGKRAHTCALMPAPSHTPAHKHTHAHKYTFYPFVFLYLSFLSVPFSLCLISPLKLYLFGSLLISAFPFSSFSLSLSSSS